MKSALAAINSEIKGLDAEMKLAVAEMASMDSAEDKQARKSEILAKQYEANAQKLDLLGKQYAESQGKLENLAAELEKAKGEFGENSAEVAKLQNEYNKQAKATQDLGTQMTKVKTEMQNAKNGMEQTSEATKEASDAMDKAKGSASTFGDMLKAKLTGEAVISGIKKLGTALKDLALGAASISDELQTQAAITGLSTDALQEYAYMAELVDTDVSTITGSLTKLTKSMTSAQKGTGSAHDAFEKLGISVTDANGHLRDNEDVFNEILDALGGVANETERDALAMELFGKSAKDLNPLIKAGSKQIKAYAQEAHDMGYVMSKDVIKRNAEASDAMERFKNAVTGAKNEIGSAFAPAITAVADAMTKLVQWSREHADTLQKVGEVLGIVLGSYLAYKAAIIAIEAPTKLAAAAQALLNSTMLANPIVAVTAALAALFISLDTLGKKTYEVGEDVVAMSDTIAATSEQIERNAAAWDAVTSAQSRNVDGILASFEYYDQLADELLMITDENGKVQEGYEDRAEVIAGVLADALGTEIKLSDGVIKNYKTLQTEIKKLIEQKKNELIMKAQEETYTEALKNRQQAALDLIKADEDRQKATEAVGRKSQELAALEAELMEYERQGRNEYNAIYMQDLEARVAAKQKEVDDLTAAQEEANASYETARQVVDDTTFAIMQYEQNLEYMHKGEYDKIITTNAEVARSYDGLSTEAKTAMDKITGDTAAAASDMYANAQKMGSNYVLGLKAGLDDTAAQSSVQRSITRLGQKMENWMQAALKEHSPSKSTQRMGVFLLKGLELGIEDEERTVLQQVADFGKTTLAAFDKAMSGGFAVDAKMNNGLQLATAGGNPALVNGNSTYVIQLQLDGKDIATNTSQYQNQWNMAYNR